MTKTTLYAGVDLGGTNLRAGVVDDAGRVLARARAETRVAEGPEAVAGRIAGAVEEALRAAGVEKKALSAAGLGSPGAIDVERGVLRYAGNFPGWKDVPLAALVSTRLGLPVRLENDANAAAWGEFWAGAGRGARSMVVLTLGTGVGGGIVLDGKLLRGVDGTAGHLGHILLVPDGRPCSCGARGCLEAYASATALTARAREAIAEGSPEAAASSLRAVPPEALTARAVGEAARAGDALALRLVRETGRFLGIALGTIANVLNPERAVIGGKMARDGELLFAPMREAMKASALATPAARLAILPAALGDDAGLVGAAGLARIRAGARAGA